MTQLLITMNGKLAREFARDKTMLDIASLFSALRTVRLIGSPGYSMRVSIDDGEVPALRQALGPNFVVEADYALETFSEARPRQNSGATGSARTQRR
jgi:hypothetical protein